jgi:hypothetical protein
MAPRRVSRHHDEHDALRSVDGAETGGGRTEARRIDLAVRKKCELRIVWFCGLKSCSCVTRELSIALSRGLAE